MQRLARVFPLIVVIAAVAALSGCIEPKPRASFTATPQIGFPPLEVTFDAAASSSPNGRIDDYEWDFGDGETATGVTATHTYTLKGVYDVTLEVRDTVGETAARTMSVEALNRAPVARLSVNVYTTAVRQPVWFNAEDSYDPDGEIVQYIWSFGDGGTAEGVLVEHEYQSAGASGWRPEITLTVVDDDGATGSMTWQIIVVGCDSCGG